MGEVQSTPNKDLIEMPNESPIENHGLLEKICEDVASGNEGDVLDMQCKLQNDVNEPHLAKSTSDSISNSSSGKTSAPQEHISMEDIMDIPLFAHALEHSHNVYVTKPVEPVKHIDEVVQ